ncbi:YceD family protein [Basilea psittacipulmonis]|uniref:Large ribosomal RNA subunit accumulation protein YceD n=1 Tax=Basilea psittacipulmonis DSM 24701 TaxID=1072685 RepID=A0A077DEU9_9BURK|nr:YceD family protein [Basilea psittacipulmonis]AIL33254.1 hypothetical protein IX83_08050 [Basilea psittacipulmonis DSM 24701]
MIKHNDLIIDSLDFARKEKSLSGSFPIKNLERVVRDLEVPQQRDGQDIMVTWSVRGHTDNVGKSFLTLSVSSVVLLVCQRCTQPFDFDLESTTVLELVSKPEDLGDDSIESIWEEVQNEKEQSFFSDKILSSTRLDLLELIEDEVILSLPYVPKHEDCSVEQDSGSDEASSDEKTSPFAVLKNLKLH